MPGSGKTTILLRTVEALKSKGLRVGGMISREVRSSGKRVGFEILSLSDGKRGWLAHVDRIAGPQIGRYHVNLEDLERIGVSAIIAATENCDVVAVDEIGPMEMCSDRFRRVILTAVGSMKLVVATIHWRERSGLARYNMLNARLFEVTLENRERLHELLAKEAIECLSSRK